MKAGLTFGRRVVFIQWGATYPVAYAYDAQGRMVQMGTYRGSTEITDHASFQSLVSSFDKTVWLYDQPTGLLTNKLYADGLGPAYTYTPDGSAPSKARRFLQGESPCRVRTSHSLVPSVGTMEEELRPNEIV